MWSARSATCQEGEVASVGTGQAVGGSTTSEVGYCATLRLPAFKIYWPSSQLIPGGFEAVETPWSRVVEHGEDVPQAIEYELSKEEADAGNQDEDREKVQAEDQKRQTPKEQDRNHNQEQAVDDASDSDAGLVNRKGDGQSRCDGAQARGAAECKTTRDETKLHHG